MKRKIYRNLRIEIDDGFPFNYQKEFYKIQNRVNYCAAGRIICNIAPNGNITPCHFQTARF